MTHKDLLQVLPMLDESVVIEVTGAQLLAALENGLEAWPSHEGRFPQARFLSCGPPLQGRRALTHAPGRLAGRAVPGQARPGLAAVPLIAMPAFCLALPPPTRRCRASASHSTARCRPASAWWPAA